MDKSLENGAFKMKNIKTKYMKINFDFMMQDYGFAIINEESKDSFGGNEVLLLEKDNIYIRIIKDRDIYSFSFTNSIIKGKKDWDESIWYDWELIKTYIDGKKNYELKERMEQHKSFFDTTFRLIKANESLSLIHKNFDKIIKIFRKQDFKEVVDKLKKYRKQRSKALFG